MISSNQFELTLFHGAHRFTLHSVRAASANWLPSVWVRTKPFPWCALTSARTEFDPWKAGDSHRWQWSSVCYSKHKSRQLQLQSEFLWILWNGFHLCMQLFQSSRQQNICDLASRPCDHTSALLLCRINAVDINQWPTPRQQKILNSQKDCFTVGTNRSVAVGDVVRCEPAAVRLWSSQPAASEA